MNRIVVEAGDADRPYDGVVTHEQLYQQLQAFCTGELYTEIPIEALLREQVLESSETGRPIRVVPDYELRLGRMRFSHNGVIGKALPRHVSMKARSEYDRIVYRLNQEQPQADWRLVAARVWRDAVNRVHDMTPRNSEAVGDFNLADLVQEAMADPHQLVRKGRNQQAVVVEAPDYRSIVHLVFADVAQGEVVDPWNQRMPGEQGRMFRYSETRELRYLPQRLREERATCKAILEAVLQADAAMLGPAPSEPPTLAEVTPTMADAMLQLRQAGNSWADIGSAFNMPWQTVRAIVTRITEPEPDESPAT